MWTPHRHKWKITGASPARMYYYTLPVTTSHAITEVLYSCDCGAIKEKDIDGAWTLDQLRGKIEIEDE